MRESDAPRDISTEPGPVPDRLKRRIGLARAILVLERNLPALIAAVTLGALFCAVAGSGILAAMPAMIRLGLAGLLLIGLVSLILRISLAPFPSTMDAAKRLDTEAGHLPFSLTHLWDHPSSSHNHPQALQLWQAHRHRIIARFHDVRITFNTGNLAARDPFALRISVWLLLAASVFVSAPDWSENFRHALSGEPYDNAPPSHRLEAWIDLPPSLRGMPIVLTDAQMQSDAPALTPPVGSRLTLRSSDLGSRNVITKGHITETQASTQERQWTIEGEASVTIRDGRSPEKVITLAAIPLSTPKITFNAIDHLSGGGIILRYTVSDDYGVAKAAINSTNPRRPGHDPMPTKEALVPPPSATIALPNDRRHGELTVRLDPNNTPWAGMTVDLIVDVENKMGVHALSETQTLLLPRPLYVDPVARALLELRQSLALVPSHSNAVIERLSALQLDPDYGPLTMGSYVALRAITATLAKAQSRMALLAVSDDLFALAETLEDEHTAKSEQALENARNALRKALEQGLSEEQRATLLDRIKKALGDLDDQAASEDDLQSDMDPRNGQDNFSEAESEMTALMNRLAKMIQSGSKEEMKQALAELDQLIANLQAQNSDGSPSDQLLNQSLSVLRDERILKDDTTQQMQGRKNEAPDQLSDRQSAISKQLQELRDSAKGADDNNAEAFDEAQSAMNSAEQALRQKDFGSAIGSQTKAIEALRRAIKSMAANQQGGKTSTQNSGNGTGKGRKSLNAKSGSGKADPFGRGSSRQDTDSGDQNWDGETQSPEAARSHELTLELWRRIEDQQRPVDEHNYYLRLLDHGPAATQ